MATKRKTARKVQSVGIHADAAPSPRTRFADLPSADRKRIAGVIIGSMRRLGFFARGGYKTVHGSDQLNRAWTSPESGGEEKQLTASERNRLIALARNAARNSERLEGILRQLEVNVIGVSGGKAIFSFPKGYEKAEEIVRENFARWAHHAEYFDDLNLQSVLKKILRTQIIGGDLVLVFDWDVTRHNSGQVIAFEPDCIGNLTNFDELFPGWSQHQGIIKDDEGKTVGVIVSWSQRGLAEYPLFGSDGKRNAWTLVKPEGMEWDDCPFVIYREMGRFNQMRGNSRLWPALGSIVDMSDGQGYEMQAMKKNAQTIAQVTQAEDQNAAQLGAELDPDAEAPVADIEATADAVAEAAEEAEQMKLDLDAIEGAGTIYDVMPPGVKMELFDTKHPNINFVEFSRWINGGAGFALGLGNIHAQGKSDSSYSAAMAEMLISDLSFQDDFHKLETDFLDWALYQWSRRAQMLHLIPDDAHLPPHWRRTCVEWQKPPKRSINPVDEQRATEIGLRNGTILYRDVYGPDWRNVIKKREEERKALEEAGLPYAPMQTVSGGIIEVTEDGEKTNTQKETHE